jgi:hypothetical protein
MLNVTMLRVVMLNVIMLIVFMRNVIMLSVVMLSVIILSVIMVNVMAPTPWQSTIGALLSSLLSFGCSLSRRTVENRFIEQIFQ